MCLSCFCNRVDLTPPAFFFKVVPQYLLSAFTFQELELLLIGQPEVDEHNWRANTEYRGVYTDSHQVINRFS